MRRILSVLICIASVGCVATTTTTAETSLATPQPSQVSETREKSEVTQIKESPVSETREKSVTTQTKETVVAQGVNCDDAGNLNQQQMNQCAQRFYEQEDRKLNKAYQELLPKLQESRRKKLITAQLQWIKFRDTSCDFERSSVEGGTLAPTIYYGCLGRTTSSRTKQLKEYITQAAN